MYCPKCKYTSFDHLSQCPKCGRDWDEVKKTLNLDWLVPSHWKATQHSGGSSLESEFSFNSSSDDSRSSAAGQGPMPSSDFLDLADSEETADFVYDLSDSPSEQAPSQPATAGSGRQEAQGSPAAGGEARPDDDIVLDFESFDLDETGDEEGEPARSSAKAGPASLQADDGEGEDDGFADLQLAEGPEISLASEQPLEEQDADAKDQDGDELEELLEDEELELDDILIELDAEDERSKGGAGSTS